MTRSQQAKDLLARVFAIIAGAALFVGALVFSVVFFAVILAAGLGFWGYYLWKTRHLRRQMRQRHGGSDVIEGTVISSEVVRPMDQIERRVPGK